MTSQDVDVSILVPVRDEAPSVEHLTKEIVEALSTSPMTRSMVCEILYVDDGSVDGTWEEVRRMVELDPRVRGVRLRRNFGKSAALAAGLASAQGATIITLDGDLQDDPAEIPGMLGRLDESTDLVAGYKAIRKDPLSKRLPSKAFNFFTSLITGLSLRDHNCGLKVGRRELFESVPLYGEMHRYLAAIAHAQGFTIVEQPVHHRPRLHGSSKFGVERYVRGALDLLTVVSLTRFGRRPAHLFGGVGLVLGLIGILALGYLTGIWFFTDQPIGNRPLLLLGALLVLVAVQLVSLGILAEMVLSQDASRHDPLRHVAETLGL